MTILEGNIVTFHNLNKDISPQICSWKAAAARLQDLSQLNVRNGAVKKKCLESEEKSESITGLWAFIRQEAPEDLLG